MTHQFSYIVVILLCSHSKKWAYPTKRPNRLSFNSRVPCKIKKEHRIRISSEIGWKWAFYKIGTCPARLLSDNPFPQRRKQQYWPANLDMRFTYICGWALAMGGGGEGVSFWQWAILLANISFFDSSLFFLFVQYFWMLYHVISWYEKK